MWGYQVDLVNKPTTTIKIDPDEEVQKWHWVSLSNDLDHIKDQLHVPIKDNILLGNVMTPENKSVNKIQRFWEKTRKTGRNGFSNYGEEKMEKSSFLRGLEKRSDDMDMSGPGPSTAVVESFISKNPNPSDDDVHDFSEERGYNNHKTEKKIYELATQQVKEKKMEKGASERVRGGLADGKPASKYPADQIEKGIKIEFEHTNNRDLAREIAKDHLEENPKYYTYLEDMEKKMEKNAFWTGFEKRAAEKEPLKPSERHFVRRTLLGTPISAAIEAEPGKKLKAFGESWKQNAKSTLKGMGVGGLLGAGAGALARKRLGLPMGAGAMVGAGMGASAGGIPGTLHGSYGRKASEIHGKYSKNK